MLAQPDERWIVEPGVRLDAWLPGEGSRVVLAPRLAVKRFLGAGQDAAVKLAVGRYAQFLHSLRDESLPVSNDTWVIADRNVPPVISDQVQLGVEAYWGDAWSASLEGYLRTFRGVTEFNLADNPNDPADDLLAGEGRSYGAGPPAAAYLRRAHRLDDRFPPARRADPPGPRRSRASTTSPPRSPSRPSTTGAWTWTSSSSTTSPRRWSWGRAWNFGSPLPYTRPVGQYFAWRYGALSGQFEPGESRGEDEPPLYVVVGERNAERYPPYHRLDVTVRRTFQRSWGEVTPYLQVLNAYNRKNNVLFYFYDYGRVPPVRSGLSMFPLLPAIGVELRFGGGAVPSR